jgi:hypothetical protein
MTYADIQANVLSKLNLSTDEAQYDNILAKIPIFCNEALGDIANRGKPLYITLIIDVVVSGTTVDTDELITNESVVTTRFVTLPSNVLSLTNEFIQRAPITVDSDGLITEDCEYGAIDGRLFRRLSNRQLLFPNEVTDFRYLVPTVCRYAKIVTDEPDTEIDIEESILELLPNYVVAELLRVDDVTLSVVYRNMYEAGLAALNDSVLAPASSLHSEGW